MIKAFYALLLVLATPTHEQSTPETTCPNVFNYEPLGSETNRWYGVVKLPSGTTLKDFRLNIVLDSKANILGIYVGDITTSDNMDYKIEYTDKNIKFEPADTLRFFVQYNELTKAPRLQAIKLNGREICNANNPQVVVDTYNSKITSDEESPAANYESRPSTDFTPSPPSGNPTISKPEGEDYFNGGPFVVSEGDILSANPSSDQSQCGVVTHYNAVPLVVNGAQTLEGQWPWQIALFQWQASEDKYICGGTLVSHRHIITAAHCVTRRGSTLKVNKDTLTVYLGKHNLRTSVEGVQIRTVNNIIIHPEYNSPVFRRDISILVMNESVFYSDWVRAACLWPSDQVDLSTVIGKLGSVVGWGVDGSGSTTEELFLAEMPVVSQETCIWSNTKFYSRLTSVYTYCAGFRNGTSVCNGDSGGGMVFKIGSAWYVRGLVSLSTASEDNPKLCSLSNYVIFTDLAKFLPWIRENIN